LQLLSEQLGRYLYPVHRLDKATSGVLMFALSSEVARSIQLMFNEQRIHKKYQAVVRGHIGEGTVDHALSDKRDQRRSGASVSHREWPGKSAISRYRCIRQTEIPLSSGPYPVSWYSLVELMPLSGRRHQLRRHMKHISHPIVGDTTYGQGRQNRLFREHFNCHRLLLCATELALPHPITNQDLCFETTVDPDFQRVLEDIGLHLD